MDDTAEKLLREWYDWWATTDEAPAKMPNGLHVRTEMYLWVKVAFNKLDLQAAQPRVPVTVKEGNEDDSHIQAP